jgi:hypothetical protein
VASIQTRNRSAAGWRVNALMAFVIALAVALLIRGGFWTMHLAKKLYHWLSDHLLRSVSSGEERLISQLSPSSSSSSNIS